MALKSKVPSPHATASVGGDRHAPRPDQNTILFRRRSEQCIFKGIKTNFSAAGAHFES